jgi:hypothetical protein
MKRFRKLLGYVCVMLLALQSLGAFAQEVTEGQYDTSVQSADEYQQKKEAWETEVRAKKDELSALLKAENVSADLIDAKVAEINAITRAKEMLRGEYSVYKIDLRQAQTAEKDILRARQGNYKLTARGKADRLTELQETELEQRISALKSKASAGDISEVEYRDLTKFMADKSYLKYQEVLGKRQEIKDMRSQHSLDRAAQRDQQKLAREQRRNEYYSALDQLDQQKESMTPEQFAIQKANLRANYKTDMIKIRADQRLAKYELREQQKGIIAQEKEKYNQIKENYKTVKSGAYDTMKGEREKIYERQKIQRSY